MILRRDYIKSISSALIERDTTYDIQLNTTRHNLLSFHKHLDERNENSTRTVNIKLISRTDDSSSSSSSSDEEAASIAQKRHSSEYETPLEVKQALKKMKPLMMKPYIERGKLSLWNA